MSVPNNPVRIYTSGNIGAQQIAGGQFDLIEMLKQVANGEFTPIQSLAVQLQGTKAVITCAEEHGLYPYQVIKLTNTGTALEGKEFFVLNDSNHTSIKFAIELGEDATALPNVITIILESLKWDIVEDTAEWFSMRPSYDKRCPLMRLSKTRNNPTAGQRRVYSAYLANDVNKDGSVIKNYTNEQWMGSNYVNSWSQTDPTAWMVIADRQFMYITFNRASAPYGNDPNYSFGSGDRNQWLRTPAVLFVYGVPSVLLEDVPLEWATIFNPAPEHLRDSSALYDNDGLRRGFLNLSTYDNTFLVARIPYDFQGNQGWARSLYNLSSGRNGLPYPTLGTYGVLCSKNPLLIQGKGVYSYLRGSRSFLSEIAYSVRAVRSQIAYNSPKVHKNSLHMGLLEVSATVGKYPTVLVISSTDGVTGSNTYDRAGLTGIRVGCSWDTADYQEE